MSSFAILLAAFLIGALIVWGGGQLLTGWLLAPASMSPPVIDSIATGTIFGMLLIGGLLGGKFSGVNAAGLGRNSLTRFTQGATIGLAGLLTAAGLAAIAGAVHPAVSEASVGLMIWGSALIALQSASEEVFFRGWVQPALVRGWGRIGVVVTAILFAALHLLGPTRNLVSVANLFLGGLLFGLLAYRYHGLAAPIGAHFAWNWAEQLLLGLDPNPGVGAFGSIWDADLVGKSWWGGSSEGLNASVAMTFALAILLTPLLVVPPSDRRQRAQHRSGRVPA